MATYSTEAGSSTQSITDSRSNSVANDSASDRGAFSDTGSERGSARGARQDEDEGTGGPALTQKWIKEHFKKEWKLYYLTFELNERLFFHYKGKLFAFMF